MSAGTAILSKHEPLSVTTTLPGHPDFSSVKGRIITLEFESCYLIGTYVVIAGQRLKVIASSQPHYRANADYSGTLCRRCTRKRNGTFTSRRISASWTKRNPLYSILESWSLRSGLASWAWRAISELRGDEEDKGEQHCIYLLGYSG